MLFFGFSFLFARTPEKAIFENYRRSRRIMGVALLLLAANYSAHYFSGIRFANANAAILLNLSTYFLCYWLFSSALTTLLDRFYITRRRMLTHIGLWALFSVLSGVILLLLPQGGGITGHRTCRDGRMACRLRDFSGLQASEGLLQCGPDFQ